MKRKRGHTQGLDQLGPTQSWKQGESLRDWLPHALGLQHSITARVLSSARHRNVKITLSDHLFSSDEIRVQHDEHVHVFRHHMKMWKHS